MGLGAQLSRVLLALRSLSSSSFGIPANTDVQIAQHSSLVTRANGYDLRLLPIGDSITLGRGSSDGNGYRLDLENMIIDAGDTVDFIGSQSDGENNPDNQHEGFGGFRISEIQTNMENDNILSEHPNLILIHAGTNDNWNPTPGETWIEPPMILDQFIEFVLCSAADAVVLVAKLIANKQNQTQTDWYNIQVPAIVNGWYEKGYKIRTVDHTNVNGDLLTDLLHPNDQGYKLMAQNWMDAINALPQDWVTKPIGPAPAQGGSKGVCVRDQFDWDVALNGNPVANGAHVNGDPGEPLSSDGDSNTFSPDWGTRTTIAIGTGHPGSGTEFVDLDGDGHADYIFVDRDTGSVRAWLNDGQASWKAVNDGNEIHFGISGGATGGQVTFGDLNGDGKPEYIYFDDSTCQLTVYENQGPNGNTWNWQQYPVVPGPGGTPCHVSYTVFADLDGSGQADMVTVNKDGTFDTWMSSGEFGSKSFQWNPCYSKGITVGDPLLFADIDGDGRADYLSIDGQGGITGQLSKPGGSCDITWVPVGGANGVAQGTRVDDSQYVLVADYDGDGMADYLLVSAEGVVDYWQNLGYSHPPEGSSIGGYGAGVRLADLDGDGRDDYISVGPNGEAGAYLNGGQSGTSWNWTLQGTNGLVAIGVGAKRWQVHFADMNGDGRADYLVVDDKTGAVHCYLNAGEASWTDKGTIAVGIGRDGGIGVRFADMNGDGRADYIYLDENGAATVWINADTGDSMSVWNVQNNGAASAIGVGAKREDVRFADIDGDGLADYIWVHPDTGAADLWYNGSPDGSDWIAHTPSVSIATGVGTKGNAIRFARMGTSGRADYVAIDEKTGALFAWLNNCHQFNGTGSGTESPTPMDSSTCATPPLPAKTIPENEPSATAAWVNLDTFEKCGDGAGSMKETIIADWNSMIDFANLVNGKLNYDEKISRDYLGPRSSMRWNHESGFKSIVRQVTTYTTGNYLGLHLRVWCNDELRRAPDCPDGTKKEDRGKCSSRCWQAVLDGKGAVIRWKTRALAYTWNAPSGRDIGNMNFCPSYFDLPSCQEAFDKWSQYRNDEKYNINNYICREYAAFHESLHLELTGQHSDYGHIYDRTMSIQSPKGLLKVTAYQGLYAKILARWIKDDKVADYTITNADSIAMWALAKWIQEKGGFYASLPTTDDRPVQIGGHTTLFDPLKTDGSVVEFGDESDLAAALNVTTDEVDLQFVFTDPGLDCWDIALNEDDPTASTCYDDANNVPLDLDGSISPIQTLAVNEIPSDD